MEVFVHGSLTAATAFSLCRTVRGHLETGIRQLFLNLIEVKATDAVGLAALLQSSRLAQLVGVYLSILPSPAIHRALIQAQLVEEVPLASGVSPEAAPSTTALNAGRSDPATPFLARTARVGLRQPARGELALFEQWAHNPLLDQMVGSELLYRCRHLGSYHPEFVSLVLNNPTSLTLLVQPTAPSAPPVGFVRLYNIRLAERFAFLETATADLRALRRASGIEASRLLLGYAMDVLGVRRVEAKAYAYNILSINALKRNGFQQEGILRQAKSYEGQAWDILLFSILEEEMKAQRVHEQFPYMGFWE
ncbi:MAG: GNAT family N-acetyltransferase [Candidatus Methylomirabilia bacterium]